MVDSDKAITSASEDALKRTQFSQELARAITSYTAEDNFTIGLCGEWGCGKTSILNMVIEAIDNTTYKNDEKPIIVQFNPWNYSDCTQLLTQFFKLILTKLEKADGNEKLKNVGVALQKYSSALEYTALIPVVGKYLSPLSTILSSTGEHIKQITDANEDVSVQKETVIKALKGQNQKIIVVIDDIDRLNNDQIRLIFKLVNLLAGFPNMIYLLSFDKEVVVRALEKEQNCNGEDYLCKIVQVPFEVPVSKKADLHKVFFDKLDKLFDEIPCGDFDREYWSLVFNDCISHFIKSIRHVNRIINVYRFKYGLMHNETNCIDLLAITTLQIYAPRIATWILHNISVLTGSAQSAGSTTGIQQKERHEQYLKQFNSVFPNDPGVMLDIIQTLFPKFGWVIGGYSYINDSDDDLKRKQRIAHQDRFHYYFNLSLEDVVITKEEILSSIMDMDNTSLSEYLDSNMQKSTLAEYLAELRCYIDDIPQNRLQLFFNELLRLYSISVSNNSIAKLAPVPAYQCKKCIYAILRRMDDDLRFDILSSLFCKANINTLLFITGILEDMESAWRRIQGSMDFNSSIISEEHLNELEKIYLKTINRIDNLLDLDYFSSITALWILLDKNGYEEYIKKQLMDATNVPKYLYYVAGHWAGGNEKGWLFKEDNFMNLITKDEAYEKVCKIKGTSEFSALELRFKQICIAFYLWCEEISDEYHNVSEKNVMALIPSWETNKSF